MNSKFVAIGGILIVLIIFTTLFVIPNGEKDVIVTFTVKNPIIGDVKIESYSVSYQDGTVLSLPEFNAKLGGIQIPFINSGDLKIIATVGAAKGTTEIGSIRIGDTVEGSVVVKGVPPYTNTLKLTLYEDGQIKDTKEVPING